MEKCHFWSLLNYCIHLNQCNKRFCSVFLEYSEDFFKIEAYYLQLIFTILVDFMVTFFRVKEKIPFVKLYPCYSFRSLAILRQYLTLIFSIFIFFILSFILLMFTNFCCFIFINSLINSPQPY